MKKFVNIIIGIVLLVMTVMNCWLVRDLEQKTIELLEIYNTEPEIVFLDSIKYNTIFIERYDTVRLTKCQVDTITLKDTTVIIDSVDVVIPIELKHYHDTLSSTAFSFDVQGYNCKIKDFYVENLISCSDHEKPLKTKPFGIGVSLGVGVTKDGFSPYIGLGFSYDIFSF